MEDSSIIKEIRSFNRYYVKILGLMEKSLHNSRYSLTEARIIFELYNQHEMTSSGLIKILGIDKGYMSRIVKKLIKKNIIEKRHSLTDKRYYDLKLTELGIKEYLKLNEASDSQIELLIGSLKVNQKKELITHMTAIKDLLSLNNK